MAGYHVRQRGKTKRWYAVVDNGRRPDGKRDQRWIALDPTIKGKRQAEEAARVIAVQRDQEQLPSDTRMTVAQLVEQWLQQRIEEDGLRPSTQADYDGKIRNHIIPHIGNMRIAEVRLRHIEQFYAKITRSKRNPSGLAPQSLKPIHAILLQSFNLAVRWEVIPRNPVDKVERPTGESKEKVVLDADQFRRLTTELAGTPLAIPAMVLGMTGMRRGELLALRWENVDLDNRMIHVSDNLVKVKGKALHVGPPKSDSSQRTIPLPSAVVDALLIHRVEQERRKAEYGAAWIERNLVFPYEDGDFWRPSTFSAAFGKVAAKAGFADITPHSLRHSYASILYNSDVDEKTIQELLGHSTLDITMDVYTTVFEKRKRAAVDKLDAAFNPPDEEEEGNPRILQ